MSINNEKVRMHRLPIYRVALVRETSQPSILNCIKTPRNVYEIAASYLEGADREHFVVTEKVVPGRWYAWVIHAKWSPRGDGRLEIWLDGNRVVNKTGPNTYDTPLAHTPYWKIGIYHPGWRGRGTEKRSAQRATITRRVIVIDDTKMGSESATYQDVAPPQS